MASEEKLYNVNKTIKGKTVSVLNNEVCLDIDMDSINANTIGLITANPGGTYIDFLNSQGFISPEYVLYKQDGGHDFTELPEYLNGDISSNPYLSYSHNGTTVYAYNNFHQYTQDGLSCYVNEEVLSQEAKNCLAEIFAGDNNFMNFLYSISTASSSEIENIITNVYGLEFLSNLFSSYTLITDYYSFNLSNNGYVAVSFVDAFSARVENYTNQNDKYGADISIGTDPETGDFTLSVTVSEIEEAFGFPIYTDYFWACTSEDGTYYIDRVQVEGFPQSDNPVVNKYIDAVTPYIDDYKADNANWVQTNVMPNTLDYDMFTLNNITFSRKGNSEEIVATMDVLNGLASDSIIVDSVSIDIVSGEDIYTVDFSGDGSQILAGDFGTVTGTSYDVELLTISGVLCNVTDFQYQDIEPELRTNVIDNINVTDDDWELTSVTINEYEPYAADGYCDAYLINGSSRKRQFEGLTINFDNGASIYLEALDWDFEAGEGNEVGQPSSGVELEDMLYATGVTSISVSYNDLYYITFDTDGGSYIEPQEVRGGEVGYEPEPPTKEGYTFSGWYDDNSYAVPFDFDTPISGDVTAYALWEPNPLVLTEGLSLCAPFQELSDRMDSYIPIEYKELHYDVGSDYPFIVSFASGSNGELLYVSADAGSLKIMLYDGVESRELYSVAFSSPTQETYVTLEEIIGSLYDLPDRFLPSYSGNDIVFTNIFDIEVRDPLSWLNVVYTTTNTEPNIYGEWVSLTLESGDTLYVQPYIGDFVTNMISDDPQYYNVEYPMGQQDSPCVFIIAKGNNGAYIGVSVGIDTFDLKLYDGYNLETLGSVTIASPEGSNATLDELCADFSIFDINPYTYSGSEPITFTILDTIYIYSDTLLTPYKTLINNENNIIVSKPSEPLNLSNGTMFDVDFLGVQEVLEDGLFGSLGNDTNYLVSHSSPLIALYLARGTNAYVGIGIQDSKYKLIVYDGVNSNVIDEVTIPNLVGSDVTLSKVIQDLSLFSYSTSMAYLGDNISLDRLNIIEVWSAGYGVESNLQDFIRNNNNVYLAE